jgi:ribosomal protein L29
MLRSSLSQSSTARVKTGQLWSKTKDDLKKQLDDLKSELGQLRVQKISGGAASKLTRMFVRNRHLYPYPSVLMSLF